MNLYMEKASREVTNKNGSIVFEISPLDQLERFLILGTASPTYYASARDLSKENVQNVMRAIELHPYEAIDKIVEVGLSNRAPKHDPVLVAYAIACASPDVKVRAYALSQFNGVVRTGTHLFLFANYYKGRGGWGRAFRRGVGRWYTEKSPESLAFQAMKYKSREGYTHADILALAHPKATSQTQNAIFKYITKGTLEADDSKAHAFIMACEEVAKTESLDEAIKLVVDFNLPREVVPTKFMNTAAMWEALVPKMGLTALIRNIRNMAKDGYLTQGSEAVTVVINRLTNQEDVTRSRIHPVTVFTAMRMAVKANRDGVMVTIPKPVLTAMETTFMMSFANVESTGKRIMLAIDTSQSMTNGNYGDVANPREWAALMAMVTARSEPLAEVYGFGVGMVPLDIDAHTSLEGAIAEIKAKSFNSRTNCAAPMQFAIEHGNMFDAFAVYTDNETNTYIHGETPSAALERYRRKSGIHDAKLAVVAVTSTGFSIADPKDKNMLDFVGFDASGPAIMSDFIAS